MGSETGKVCEQERSPSSECGERKGRVFSSDHDSWLQWEYSSEEWAQFDALDWNPTRLRIWLLAGSTLILLLGMGIFPFWLSSLDLGEVIGIVFGGGITLLMAPLFAFAFSFASLQEGRKRHRARQSEAHRVTFSKQGVWEAGAYFPIDDGGMTLMKVSMRPAPPILHFRRSKFINYESTPQTVTLRVLVPRGREAEAERLRQRYQSELLDAREKMLERSTNPPEPR
jgi:hypothetical protein